MSKKSSKNKGISRFQGKTKSTQDTHGSDEAIKPDDVFPVHQLNGKKGKWESFRLLPGVVSRATYQVPIKSKDGKPTGFTAISPVWDIWNEEYIQGKTCPWQKLGLRASIEYFMIAISRDVQDELRKGKVKWSKSEKKSLLIDPANDETKHPVIVLRLTGGVMKEIKNLSTRNVHKVGKNKKVFSAEDLDHGVDVDIDYNSKAKSPGDYYTVTLGRPNALTDVEKGYAVYDLELLEKTLPTYEDSKRNAKDLVSSGRLLLDTDKEEASDVSSEESSGLGGSKKSKKKSKKSKKGSSSEDSSEVSEKSSKSSGSSEASSEDSSEPKKKAKGKGKGKKKSSKSSGSSEASSEASSEPKKKAKGSKKSKKEDSSEASSEASEKSSGGSEASSEASEKSSKSSAGSEASSEASDKSSAGSEASSEASEKSSKSSDGSEASDKSSASSEASSEPKKKGKKKPAKKPAKKEKVAKKGAKKSKAGKKPKKKAKGKKSKGSES